MPARRHALLCLESSRSRPDLREYIPEFDHTTDTTCTPATAAC